jgi:hypothetical protein
MSEQEAMRWPDLMAVVRAKVKPERDRLGNSSVDRSHKQNWWRFANDRPEMMQAIRDIDRVLVCSRIGNAFAFTFLPRRVVMNEKIVVFPFSQTAPFCVIQSRIHEAWARFFSSTLKDDLQYTPSDCFETFAFPEDFKTSSTITKAGLRYYEFRASLMAKNNEGLTKTYNHFHTPAETSPDIIKLRELHAAMDRAVLDAYGWTDLQPTCEFLLDYEDEEDDEPSPQPSRGRGRKKPWRYRWPDDFHDEVLARLLELNKKRAEEEALSGQAAEAATTRASKKGRRKKNSKDQPPCLPGME